MKWASEQKGRCIEVSTYRYIAQDKWGPVKINASFLINSSNGSHLNNKNITSAFSLQTLVAW